LTENPIITAELAELTQFNDFDSLLNYDFKSLDIRNIQALGYLLSEVDSKLKALPKEESSSSLLLESSSNAIAISKSDFQTLTWKVISSLTGRKVIREVILKVILSKMTPKFDPLCKDKVDTYYWTMDAKGEKNLQPKFAIIDNVAAYFLHYINSAGLESCGFNLFTIDTMNLRTIGWGMDLYK
jgi:hypothetical protein